MTDPTIAIADAISDRFIAGVEEACAAGRGKEHWLDYLRELARYMAGVAFMWCDSRSVVAQAKGMAAEQFLAELTQHCAEAKARNVALVRTAFEAMGFGHAATEIAEAEAAAGDAFTAELERLFAGASGPGGRA